MKFWVAEKIDLKRTNSVWSISIVMHVVRTLHINNGIKPSCEIFDASWTPLKKRIEQFVENIDEIFKSTRWLNSLAIKCNLMKFKSCSNCRCWCCSCSWCSCCWGWCFCSSSCCPFGSICKLNLIEFNAIRASSINASNMRNTENARQTMPAAATKIVLATKYNKLIATKYPNGFRQSNRNLKIWTCSKFWERNSIKLKSYWKWQFC